MDDLPFSETRNWMAMTGLSRRAALCGSAVAAGFAAACRPVASTAKQTDGEGLDEENIVIPSGDFSLPGFRARPKGNNHAPVLIVVHEIFGVHEWIRDMCRRFAKAGYYAIAPDLFARLGDASKERDIQALMTNFVPKTADAQVMRDIDHTVAFASGDGGDTDRDRKRQVGKECVSPGRSLGSR